jgi:hypothetical protein
MSEALAILLSDAKLPGRITAMQDKIGETLANLCSMTAYDLSKLKGVGSNVIDETRAILGFYGLNLQGDPECEAVEGALHPVVALYRERLDDKYAGMAEVLGTDSDRVIGEKFGVSAQSINNHRRMLGIARAERTNKGGKKDRRIAALTAAVNEALHYILSELWDTPNVPALTAILKAALVESSDDDAEISPEDAKAVVQTLAVTAAPVASTDGVQTGTFGSGNDTSDDDPRDGYSDDDDDDDDDSDDDDGEFDFGDADFTAPNAAKGTVAGS